MKYPYEGKLGAKLIELEAKGWVLDKRGKHLKFRSPSGRHLCVFPQTPSDRRGRLNSLTDLKRAERAEYPCGSS